MKDCLGSRMSKMLFLMLPFFDRAEMYFLVGIFGN